MFGVVVGIVFEFAWWVGLLVGWLLLFLQGLLWIHVCSFFFRLVLSLSNVLPLCPSVWINCSNPRIQASKTEGGQPVFSTLPHQVKGRAHETLFVSDRLNAKYLLKAETKHYQRPLWSLVFPFMASLKKMQFGPEKVSNPSGLAERPIVLALQDRGVLAPGT